ncbi:MAG: hypothetical protein AAGM22_06015 [Acidobacteriota bacterium]
MSAAGDALFLATKSLRASKWRSAILIFGTAVAAFLPLFTFKAAALLEKTLLARAAASPVVIGQKGDEFDLTMNALYFRGQVAESIPFGERKGLAEYGLALPLYVAYSISGTPLVGTSVEYFDARGLEVAEGRLPALLGEVVAGADVAAELELEPGDRMRSDLTNLYNLAGSYPLLLDVVGVLRPRGTPDDGAFFADVKTAWMLDGRLHGHEEVTPELAETAYGDPDVDALLGDDASGDDGDPIGAPETDPPDDAPAEEAAGEVEEDEGEEDHIEATAAIFLFAEITAENRNDFHMHGSVDDAPVGSFLVLPRSVKRHDQLLGEMALHEKYQAVRPVTVIETVLEIVLRLRDGLSAYFALVAFSTLAFFGLALTLSLRLRRDEMMLMRRIGCGRFRIAALIGTEVALVVVAAVVTAVLASELGLWLLDAALRG